MIVHDWDVPCPKCEAEAGWACINVHGNPYRRKGVPARHAARRRAATQQRILARRANR